MRDATRAAVAELGLIGEASTHLTTEIAMHLPFEALGPFKDALKQFFSGATWTAADESRLSALVTEHVPEGMWEHDLGHGITLSHGIVDGTYLLRVEGDVEEAGSIFDRVFSGPVIPSQTPHPRKVKFTTGGAAAPGVWHRRGEEIEDIRVASLMEDQDVTDVMVAGDFVTVGLAGSGSWEDRLDDVLSRVEELFWTGDSTAAPERTREDMLAEAGGLTIIPTRAEDLHLMDPDRKDHHAVLVVGLGSDDARRRRAAVATLSLSARPEVAKAALVTGYRDRSRLVRRTAIDAAADLGDEEFRPLFEEALDDVDAWTRWKAVRALADLGAEPSQEALILAAVDEDFRVRFEAEAALRGLAGPGGG